MVLDKKFTARNQILYHIHSGRDSDALAILEGLLVGQLTPYWLDLYWYLLILERQGEHYEIARLARRWNEDEQIEDRGEGWCWINWALLKASLRLEDHDSGQATESNSRNELLCLIEQLKNKFRSINQEQLENKIKHSSDYPPGYYQPLQPQLHLAFLEQLLLVLSHSKDINVSMAIQLLTQPSCSKPSSNTPLDAAIKHFQEGEYDQCIDAIRQLRSLVIPLWTRELWAVCLFAVGRVEELEYWSLVLQQEASQSPLSLYVTGLWYQLRGPKEAESARRCLAQAAEKAPGHVGIWLALGHWQAAQGEHELAIEAYEQVRQAIDPHHQQEAILALGSEWLRVRDCNQASICLREAHQRDSQCPRVLNELGVLFWQRGEWQKAETAFTQALLETQYRDRSIKKVVEGNLLRARLYLACQDRVKQGNEPFLQVVKQIGNGEWLFGKELKAIFENSE